MPHFCRLTCGPIGRSLRRALSTWSACTFNISSSSSSVAGTAWSGLRRLAALLSTHCCERYPTAGQAIPPPLHTSCYSPPTAAPRRTRTSYNPYTPLNLRLHCCVFPSLGHSRPGPRRRPPPRCARCGVVNKRGHRKRNVRGEPDGWDPRGPWSHARKVPPY